MAWIFDSNAPIFKQIVDTISLKIIKGDYKTGQKLDSVRDLAVEAGVNPNTMQRALVSVEEMGLLETKRGDGRYITENTEIISKLKEDYIRKNTADFIKKMSEFGFSTPEIISFIEKTNINL
ncbi:MAG: GntR family transcriptional regulator [Clostridia bacterium]|nr:GntR family transcriptional regulator [Clostridia bacterium]